MSEDKIKKAYREKYAATKDKEPILRIFLVNEQFQDIRIFDQDYQVGKFDHFLGSLNEDVKIGEKIASHNLKIVFEIVDIIHTIRNARNSIIYKYIVLRPLTNIYKGKEN